MVHLNLLHDGPPDKTEREQKTEPEERDWKKSIPPWMLLVLLSLSMSTIGWLVGQLDRATDKQYKQLEEATRNARDAYVAGLSERIAIIEADQRSLKESMKETNSSMSKVIAELKTLSITNERLSTRVETLTSQLSRNVR